MNPFNLAPVKGEEGPLLPYNTLLPRKKCESAKKRGRRKGKFIMRKENGGADGRLEDVKPLVDLVHNLTCALAHPAETLNCFLRCRPKFAP